MAAVSLPQDLAAQIKYGAQTGSAIRRSQYLADALRQIGTTGSTNIQSGGELAAKLLATAILNKAGKSADRQALQSIADQQSQETDSILAGFGRGPAAAPVPQMAPQPVQPPPPQPAPAPQPPPPQAPPQAAPAAFQASPEDRDALTRMLATEAIGEGPDGMAAAGHVALNRLKSGYGGAKTLKDVIFQPHQFEGMSRANQVTPEAYAKAGQVADAILSGQMPDPTRGAMAFLNPDLQVKLGRQIPKWAAGGDGRRIGNHVFFGGGQPQQMAQQAAPPPQSAPDLASFAAGGAGADPFPPPPPQPIPPSAPSASPGPAAGTAPAGNVPQAEPAGATAHAMGITSEQIGFLEKLLRNPRTHEAGMAYAMELQKKAAEPTKFDTTNVNNLPVQVDPYTGQVRRLTVPDEARTHVRSAQEAGIAAPPGTSFAVDPLGNTKQVYQPQNGQQIVSAPNAPYAEAPIQGGTNDPRAPAARFVNEGKLRDDYAKEVQPYVQAREGYQKVVQAAGDMSQAGAIALVFGYMKTLDPGSTVREGEQATVNNSGSIPQTIANMYNKLVAGQSSLTPQQREQFAASAQGQFNVYKRTFDAANERYGELARNYGYDPNNVIRHFDDIKPYVAPAPGEGGSRAPIPQAAQDAYRARFQRGLIDPKAPPGTQANPLQARDAATLHALDVPANKGKYVIGPDGQFGVID